LRIWEFSDLHLRPGGSEAMHRFIDMAYEEKPDLIIGLGDVLELLLYTFQELLEDDESNWMIARMKKMAETIETWWVPGNHDLDLKDHQDYLEPIKVMDAVELDGIHFEHGHRADPLTQYLWNPICQSAWWSPPAFRQMCRFCPQLYKLLYPTPWEIKHKNEDGWKWYCSAYEVFYQGEVQRDGVHYVHGHTHQPFLMEMMGGLYLANSGDMVDSRTFLDISDGTITLRRVQNG